MKTRDYQLGDIVAIKSDFLVNGESPEECYVIIEVLRQDRVVVRYVDTRNKFPFGLVHTYSTEWITYTGHSIN